MPPKGAGGNTGQKKKKKGHAPAHQNQFAFRHNPKSKTTDKILSSPNQHVCRRCHEKIEWRKQYRKYKPRTQPGKCNICSKKNVKAAYHTICGNCTFQSSKAKALLLEWNTTGEPLPDSEPVTGGEEQPLEEEEKESAIAATTKGNLKQDDTAEEEEHEESDDEESESGLDDNDDMPQPTTSETDNNEEQDEETEPRVFFRVCAVCVNKPALPASDDEWEDDKEDIPRKLSLRERRTVERNMSKPSAKKTSVNQKPTIQVLEAEDEIGPVEYKRQVGSSPSRLQSLGTQMLFRMDQGMEGTCTYQVGVEDDGCHSLLDYPAIAESCQILEFLARRFNAIVVERTMIQDEIILDSVNEYRLASPLEPFVFEEPSILGDALGKVRPWPEGETSPIKERRSTGFLTRAQLRIQRVETHSLEQAQLLPVMAEEVNDESNAASAIRANGNTREHQYDQTSIVKNKKPSPEGIVSHRLVVVGNQDEFGDSSAPEITNGGASATANTSTRITQPTSLDNGHGDTAPGSTTIISPSSSNNTIAAATTSPMMKSLRRGGRHSVGETLSFRNVRIAVMGNVDAGKSTLIGTLTTGLRDDGRGKTRTFVMKHRHEIETGRTSTATSHLMGFSSKGKPISGRDSVRSNKIKGEDEIAKESHRVVTLQDCAGHEKYFKTAVSGVSSFFADYAVVLVNARNPPTHMTLHHLNLCVSFNIPIMVVFTKVDACPEHALDNSQAEVVKMLQSTEITKQPMPIEQVEDVGKAVDELAKGALCEVVPMIHISCVTGQGIELLQKLFFSLPKRRQHAAKSRRAFEFLVEEVFNVPNVGTVVSGFVNGGELSLGKKCVVYVGPLDDGTFVKTEAKSAHIARINTTHISSGQSASMALSIDRDVHSQLRRGMVVLQEKPGPTSCTMEFEAEICVLKGEMTTIREPHQTHIHVLSVRQTAIAKDIELVRDKENKTTTGGSGDDHDVKKEDDGAALTPGSRAKVRFQFLHRPEYVRPGMRLLFRDGRVRGVGLITSIPPPSE